MKQCTTKRKYEPKKQLASKNAIDAARNQNRLEGEMGEKYGQHSGRAQACYDAAKALRKLMVNTEPLDTDQVEDGITKAFQALEGTAWMSRVPEERVLAFGILAGTQLLENLLKILL